MTIEQAESERTKLDEEFPEPIVKPWVIFHKDFDHGEDAEYARCELGEPGSPASNKLKHLIQGGWKPFRIQTEYFTKIGHVTCAYLVKLKSN